MSTEMEDICQEAGALMWALALRGETGLTAGWLISIVRAIHPRRHLWGGMAVALWYLWRQVAREGWGKMRVTSYLAQRAAEAKS